MKMNKLNKINNFKSCFNLCLMVLLLCSFALPGNAFAQQGSDNCIPCSDCDTFELWRFMCTYISQICDVQGLPTEFCEEQRELCDKNIDDLITRCRGICNANCNGEEEEEEEKEDEVEENDCHTHEDLLWLDNNDYDIKVIEKGCTGTCGTEYLVEFREEFTPGSEDHCGEQAWIWLESGSTPLEVNECYRVYIYPGTGICGPMIVDAYKKTCPDCEPTGTCNGGVPDGTCEAGENCPEDADSCPANTCMTPTCEDGCGETHISSGSRHRNCNDYEGCPTPPCSCDGQGNCIGSKNCQTHEDPAWIAGDHILQIIQEGCTEENGCYEMGADSSTEYLVEVKDDDYCGEQLWLWVDEKMNQNPPEIGKCYDSFIMKYEGDCNAYVIRYLYSEVDCPGCEPTADCHNHEDPAWLETNDYELVVIGVGCTNDCGTEYLVEIRRGEHCGEQFWIWRDEPGTAPLEVGNCYWTFINTDTSCGYAIDISRKIETCPGCISDECANTACGAANTDLPCQCGTAKATADAPWCCAADSNVYPTDFDCITSPSCSDQSGNCRIDISFNKDEFCPGDNLAMTLEFLEDGNYIDYREMRATLKKPTESDQDLSEDFTRTDTGIYVTYGGIGNTTGERTLEVEALFGGCEEEASASYTVLSGDDPGCESREDTECLITTTFDKEFYCEDDDITITTEFRSNDILKDPTYFGVMVDRIGTSVDISDRYVWQSEGVYIFEGTLGSEGVRTLYATAYFDDGCHATETQDFFVYSTGECPGEEPECTNTDPVGNINLIRNTPELRSILATKGICTDKYGVHEDICAGTCCNGTDCQPCMKEYYCGYYPEYNATYNMWMLYDCRNYGFDACNDGACIETTTTSTFNLHKGENRISFPVIPKNNSVVNVFKPILGSLSIVWTYDVDDNDHWKKYDPSNPFPHTDDLKEILPGRGYIVTMETAADLEVKGTKVLLTADGLEDSLKIGWNMVGPGDKNIVLANKVGLWRYDQDSEYIEHTTLEIGKGYWINCNSTETSCDDDIDNDCDGLIDGDDDDCPGNPETSCGDVNCDRNVDDDDLDLLSKYVGHPDQHTICNYWAGDVTCSGAIDIGDVVVLRNHIANKDTYPLSCCSAASLPPCDSYGDLDDDGYITDNDLSLFKQLSIGDLTPTEEQEKRADLNGNGEAGDAGDLVLIKSYVLGEIDTFPIC